MPTDSASRADTVTAPRALPAPVRVPLTVVAVCSAVTVAVLGVLFAGESTGTAFDARVRAPLVDVGAPWRQLALVVDYTAEPVGFALVLGALVLGCLWLGQRRTAVLAVVGTGLSIACTTGLKPVVGRDINNGFLAFPSGHTATATALALVVVFVVVHRRRLAAPAATALALGAATAAGLAMAWSQVLLNSHYPTDTVGGFATALAVVPPTAWVVDRVADRVQGLEIRK